MQYVRSISGSVSKTWNSINPATLSGAIDVVVVEREDGTLACSPFHVRFGKFQLLRPSDKKVEFTVNDVKRKFPMKVGEGGEAFFVFETSENIPQDLQTSPIISPAVSPQSQPTGQTPSIALPEPEPLDLTKGGDLLKPSPAEQFGSLLGRPKSADGTIETHDEGLLSSLRRPNSGDWTSVPIAPSEIPQPNPDNFPSFASSYDRSLSQPLDDPMAEQTQNPEESQVHSEAFARAVALSKKLWSSNIPTIISSTGDLMLDMTGFKSSEEQALKVELVARRILSEDLEGGYDIGSLIGADEKGNIWIYSSEEAKEAADRKAGLRSLNPAALRSTDALSDPGYHSDDAQSETGDDVQKVAGHSRTDSDSALGLSTPGSPEGVVDKEEQQDQPIRNYAKTLRLTNDQLKSLDLKPGANTMSFTVNKATCQAVIYYWRHDVPIVISDIDGTITKSDALGHVLNMIGRDWTHIGVAKLYTDIAANGYNIMYLTSRSVGQADTTRGYLNGVLQNGYRLPKGPVIMSPDRTMVALRREVYLRKPEVFKMACLRDIKDLFTWETQAIDNTAPNSPIDMKPASLPIHQRTPFYAGFGNRLTDALSYRSVGIPPTRIFTINSNAEVSLHLLTLNSYRTSYLSIWELVDHYFPPIGLLVKDGGEEYTDFNYWRDKPREITDFSDSSINSDEELDEDEEYDDHRPFILDDETEQDDMESSFMSRGTSIDEPMRESGMLDTVEEDAEEDADDEDIDDEHHNRHHHHHHQHHHYPDAIPEEDKLDDDDIPQDHADTAIIDDAGDLLVEESRQLQALDLAAEEETLDHELPAPLMRSATVPNRDERREMKEAQGSSDKDGQNTTR